MANSWATVFWQLGDTPQQLRRTVAMPDETVGTLMRRALEEASILGFISEEEAYSKDVMENWQAYVQFQGSEQLLQEDDRLDERLPRKGGRLLFRPSPNHHLRAAPLRLSLDGITYTPPPPPKTNKLLTGLLILIVLALLGVVSLILWQRLSAPSDDPGKTDKRVVAPAALADAGTAPRAIPADAGAAKGLPDGVTPEGSKPESVADGQDKADEPPPRARPRKRPVKRRAKQRRRRRRRSKKRRRRRSKKRRRRRKRSRRKTKNKRRKRRSKKRKKRTKKRSKTSRKPPPRR